MQIREVADVVAQQSPASACGEDQLFLVRRLLVAKLLRAVRLVAMAPESSNEIEVHIMIQVQNGFCHVGGVGKKRPDPCAVLGAGSALFRHRSLPGNQNSRQERHTPGWE